MRPLGGDASQGKRGEKRAENVGIQARGKCPVARPAMGKCLYLSEKPIVKRADGSGSRAGGSLKIAPMGWLLDRERRCHSEPEARNLGWGR